jgi:hypothetical protein
MHMHSITRVPLIAALVAAASPAVAQGGGMFFDGGGYGPTEDIAVQRAIEDAEVSASAYQLYTCELVGEPQIFPGTHPVRGPVIRAQVRVFCKP